MHRIGESGRRTCRKSGPNKKETRLLHRSNGLFLLFTSLLLLREVAAVFVAFKHMQYTLKENQDFLHKYKHRFTIESKCFVEVSLCLLLRSLELYVTLVLN